MNRLIFKFRGVGVLIVLAVAAVFSAVIMALWNALMPDIFALPAITYWQALGLLALSRILFGGVGGVFQGLGMARARGMDMRQQNPLRAKWMNMSAEERKAFFEKEKGFRNMFRDRAGFYEFYEAAQNKKDSEKQSADVPSGDVPSGDK
jgi:ABC-type multidrug transport system fused ATPase/permease subunit